MQHNNNSFSFFAEFDDSNQDIFDIPFGEVLSVLPLRDIVLFPGVIIPVGIGRPLSMSLVRDASATGTIIATATQVDENIELPSGKDLYPEGVAARVLRIFDLPDGNCTAIIQGLCPIHLDNIQVDVNGIHAHVVRLREVGLDDTVLPVLQTTLRDRMLEYMHLSDRYGDEDIAGLNATFGMRFFLNNVCTNAPLPVSEKIGLLAESSLLTRGTRLLRLLAREIQFARLRSEIQQQTQADIDKQQRDFFLQQQLHNIQEQLGNTSQDDVARFREKAYKLKMPEEAYDTFLHEVEKLERLNPQSPDYQVLYNYLEVMLQLPWGIQTHDNLNLSNAERVLNKNHYGCQGTHPRTSGCAPDELRRGQVHHHLPLRSSGCR